MVPQYWPPVAGLHVSAVQLAAPHTFAVPAPPQVCPVGHVPQSTLPPQPSPTVPQ
jgi:hypothetical protein